jgi:hypothetical protein
LRRKTSIFAPFLSVHFAAVIGVQFAADYAQRYHCRRISGFIGMTGSGLLSVLHYVILQ